MVFLYLQNNFGSHFCFKIHPQLTLITHWRLEFQGEKHVSKTVLAFSGQYWAKFSIYIHDMYTGVGVQLWAWVFSAVRVRYMYIGQISYYIQNTKVKYHLGCKSYATDRHENLKTQWEKWEHIPQPNAGAQTFGG